ncbi:thiol:disulfide interchange protein [Flavobacterium sp. CYK-4]|uniref:protein-disulfide reductase DsbD family protein n=1 Tax=Flavobacterium lotistagni TaxID=2709660 RepID=UPI0014073C0B|nr:cytochrome c biogenesis protein CcdA [Flavobacterium lotistagni]NHM07376.1 thiol:disulfide interchange protein [Flavobacterium lotistagni]
MRKIFSVVLVFIALTVQAQILQPVKWSSKTQKKSATNVVLIFDATIEKEWHVYSQFTDEGGSLPMELTFKDQQGNYSLVGKTKERNTKTGFNEVFGVNETYFEGKIHFEQEIKVTNPKLKKIEVAVDYQACKASCVNLVEKFKFTLPEMTTEETAIIPTAVDTTTIDTAKVVATAAEVKETPAPKTEIAATAEKTPLGLWSIFFIAFLSGFAALLTPCVFPLIPMTVSFFTKQSKTKAAGIRNAIIYGISIIVIYVVLGSLVTAIFGADALNALATNVWFNVIFFLLLVFFAASFLGAFEIMLPNSWANKVDRQADRGGIIGILFMALALAIVSFSCTGPIVGTLLFEAASRGGIGPIVGMLGFSTALALPFMLFAMFPGWLQSLPKSGGWLNTVKVFLGFLELALAFKFLSNADLVLQLHLLEREVFLAIWIAIFGALALYLFGKISTPHDSPLTHISVGRLLTGLLVLSFTVYMIPGLWGAPLRLINAFPPPMEYSESPFGVGGSSAAKSEAALPEGAVSGPHGITVFNDYDKGLAYAKSVNKPIMLDFTGYACVNCRKMENNVWVEAPILSILKNEVVLISLYVDDKRTLPEHEQTVSKATGAEIETVGDKWTDFMITNYKTNTQPLYVLTDLQGNNLNPQTPTMSYTSFQEYESWLRAGLANFKK